MASHQVTSTTNSFSHLSFGKNTQSNNTQPNQLSTSSAAKSGAKGPLYGTRLLDLLLKKNVHTHCAIQCTDLGIELGLSPSDVDVIVHNHPFDKKMQCSEILKLWCETFKAHATPEVLQLALEQIRLVHTARQLFSWLGYSGQPELFVETEKTDKTTMTNQQLIVEVERLEELHRYLVGQLRTQQERYEKDILNKARENEGLNNKIHALQWSQRNQAEEMTRLKTEVNQLKFVLSSFSSTTSNATSSHKVPSSVSAGAQSAYIDDSKGFMAVYNKEPDIGSALANIKSLNRIWWHVPSKHWKQFAFNLGLNESAVDNIEMNNSTAQKCIQQVFKQRKWRPDATYRAFALAVYKTMIDVVADEKTASQAAFEFLYAERY